MEKSGEVQPTKKRTRHDDPADIVPLASKVTLKQLRSKLSNHFMIVGGIANVFYGTPRLTRDLVLAVAVVTGSEKENILALAGQKENFVLIYPESDEQS